MRSNVEAAMGHIRLLSRLHCAIRRARSVMRIILITTFHESSGMKQNEEALISPMQLPHSSAVKPETLVG